VDADPSWERATLSERMEEDLRRVCPGEFAVDEHGKEIRGRMDIRYITNSGKHVIVETKRYLRVCDIDELVEQGAKYAVAIKQLRISQGEADPDIEVVFVLGSIPTASQHALQTEADYRKSRMGSINGRFLLYDQLIGSARNQYDQYLQASGKARRLDELLGSLTAIDTDQL
jgi:hypothetical protein